MSAYTHAASTTYTLHSLHQPRFLMSDLNPQFEDAAAWLSGNPAAGSLSNDIKLEIYGIYKVVTVSPQPDSPAPSFFSLPATKAKWTAWSTQGEKYGSNTDEACERYLEIAEELGYKWKGEGKSSGSGVGGGAVSAFARDESEEQYDVEPIHDAAAGGDLERLKEILKSDPLALDRQDEFGMTPLHFAADRGQAVIIKHLLQEGADKTIEDNDAQTPYQLAEPLEDEQVLSLLRD